MLNNKIVIRLIEYGTVEYEKELELRDEVLRKPIGLSIFDDDIEKEINDYHIGAFKNEELIGILILTPVTDSIYQIKMRQVAIVEHLRGKQIGKKLTTYAEKLAKQSGYKKIVLSARKTAVLFYEKLGYQTEGDEFTEVGIPHMKMEKLLG